MSKPWVWFGVHLFQLCLLCFALPVFPKLWLKTDLHINVLLLQKYFKGNGDTPILCDRGKARACGQCYADLQNLDASIARASLLPNDSDDNDSNVGSDVASQPDSQADDRSQSSQLAVSPVSSMCTGMTCYCCLSLLTDQECWGRCLVIFQLRKWCPVFELDDRGWNSLVGSVLGWLSCVMQRRRFDPPLSYRWRGFFTCN